MSAHARFQPRLLRPEDVPTLPRRFEPGDVLPSRMLIAHMRALHRQAMLVDVLGWILENEPWLSKAKLDVCYGPAGVWTEECTITWSEPTPSRTEAMATRALYRLSALLDFVGDRDDNKLPAMSKKIIHALNAIAWQPAQAIEALAPIAPHISTADAPQWLARHGARMQALLLRRNTRRQGKPPAPSRRL